jgi:hypothetical protein
VTFSPTRSPSSIAWLAISLATRPTRRSGAGTRWDAPPPVVLAPESDEDDEPAPRFRPPDARLAVARLADERLAVARLAPPDDFRAEDFLAEERFAVDDSDRADDFRAVDLRAVDFRAVDLRAVDFRAVDFRAVDLRAEDFLAVERFAPPDLRAEDFLAPERLLLARLLLEPELFRALLRAPDVPEDFVRVAMRGLPGWGSPRAVQELGTQRDEDALRPCTRAIPGVRPGAIWSHLAA